MSSSISSHLRLFSPQLRRNLNSHKPISTIITQTPPFLSSKPLLSSSSTTITFSRLQPIKSQLQQDQTPSSDHVEPTLLPKNLQDIIALFQSVQDPKAKYHQLLHYGNKLPPLDTRYKTEEHRVRGCVSQVWVRAFADPDDPSAIRFEADSDSALTKGLAALLVMGLSGAPAPVIAQLPPEFVHLLGLRQSLTPSRNNGFLNMLKLMQQKALQLYAKDDSVAVDGVSDGKDSNLSRDTNGLGVNSLRGAAVGVNGSRDSVKYKVSETKNSNLDMNGEPVDSSLEARISSLDGSGDAPSSLLGGRGERIRERLERELSPVELEVEDISYQHAGHASVRASKDGETHFNVKIVSKEFEGKSMVKRHRLVYDLLQGELQSGLHALSIVAKTPSEVSPRWILACGMRSFEATSLLHDCVCIFKQVVTSDVLPGEVVSCYQLSLVCFPVSKKVFADPFVSVVI